VHRGRSSWNNRICRRVFRAYPADAQRQSGSSDRYLFHRSAWIHLRRGDRVFLELAASTTGKAKSGQGGTAILNELMRCRRIKYAPAQANRGGITSCLLTIRSQTVLRLDLGVIHTLFGQQAREGLLGSVDQQVAVRAHVVAKKASPTLPSSRWVPEIYCLIALIHFCIKMFGRCPDMHLPDEVRTIAQHYRGTGETRKTTSTS